MLRVIAKIVTTIVIGLACSGCLQETGIHSTASQLERNWGRSFETAKYNQILNPEAQNDLSPVENMEGVFAVRPFDAHLNGKTETKKPSSQFGILTVKQ